MSSSEEEEDIDCKNIIKTVHIKYDNKNDRFMTNHKDLEFYNKLYRYKKKLEERDIIFYITDKDLIDLHNDDSDVLYLRLVKDQPTSDNNDKKHLSPKPHHHSQKVPTIRPASLTKSSADFHSLSSHKKHSPSFHKEKQEKMLVEIDKIAHTIHYEKSEEQYSLFKIENNNNKIICIGTFENKINSSELLQNNYMINTIEHNDIKYYLFSKFDNFKSPVYIEVITDKISYTVANFMNILEHIITKNNVID